MAFDAHERAFAFFRGACGAEFYDNMKTAVETIFVGKDRQQTSAASSRCARTISSSRSPATAGLGWEKGQAASLYDGFIIRIAGGAGCL